VPEDTRALVTPVRPEDSIALAFLRLGSCRWLRSAAVMTWWAPTSGRLCPRPFPIPSFDADGDLGPAACTITTNESRPDSPPTLISFPCSHEIRTRVWVFRTHSSLDLT